jgi:hypothetical protein
MRCARVRQGSHSECIVSSSFFLRLRALWTGPGKEHGCDVYSFLLDPLVRAVKKDYMHPALRADETTMLSKPC